ncbi:hypothetical protein N4T77_02560 [Clostridium sp. CX1]|uniref:hypothetical protein n=1 Tax=Clostridium sp. CX1 TaxID=2978346 RepID=UPI0021C08006|nr:hypothetical protein [Clostridium sp. CX1]MCT8975472.1 hypothetical protein [Clostridium sp. CX1]
MATKGFTKINNSIIFDANLSLEAIGLYAKLQYLSTIKNFSIKRDYIKSISGYGETAFRRVWKELKDKCVLVESKTRNKGRYEYVYSVKTDLVEDKAEITAPVEESKTKHIDSDGNAPIEGQIDIDEVIVDEKEDLTPAAIENPNIVKEETEKAPDASKDIEVISNTTGFDKEESKELLKLACNDIVKIIKGHGYAVSQKSVKNVFAYTKWVLENYKSVFKDENRLNLKNIKAHAVSTFNNFTQRNYDFKELEMRLLYGIEGKSLYMEG